MQNAKYQEFALRLKSLMDQEGSSIKNVNDLKDAIDVTYEMARRYTLGIAKPRDEKMAILAERFRVDMGYLAHGSPAASTANQISFTTNISQVTARMAPVLSWVQAGNWTNMQAVDLSHVDEWLPLPENECSNCFYLKVQGLSNYPDFLEGDYIVVDPDVYFGDMQSGDMIVVRRGEDATFKRLVIETDGSKYLQALNPEFKPNILPIDEQCLFVGQVVDCVRYIYKGKRRKKNINS